MSLADLTEQKLISVRDLETLAGKGIREIRVREGAVFTPSARDIVRDHGLTVVSRQGTRVGRQGRAAAEPTARRLRPRSSRRRRPRPPSARPRPW